MKNTSNMKELLGSLVLSLLFLALPSLAQQNPNAAPGFKAEGVYDFGGLDQVSLFSGGLSLTIPIGQTYSGKGGFSYQLTAQYSSSGWDSRREIVAMVGQNPGTPIRGPVVNPKYRNNAGFGWRVSLGELIAHDDFYSPQSENFAPLSTNQWTYVSQDGAEHTFYKTLHRDDDLVNGVWYTRDGSYLRMTWVNGTPTEPFKVIIDFPNGSKQTFTRYQLPEDDPNPDEPYPHFAYRLMRIHDASGNVIKISYASNHLSWSIYDGLRTHTVYLTEPPAGNDEFIFQKRIVDRIELACFGCTGGDTATYQFQYAEKDILRPQDFPDYDLHERQISSPW